jgi:hypothetical protein
MNVLEESNLLQQELEWSSFLQLLPVLLATKKKAEMTMKTRLHQLLQLDAASNLPVRKRLVLP